MTVCACPKVAYSSKAEAKSAKRSCQRSADAGIARRAETRIYRCPSGSGWHLTSTALEDWTDPQRTVEPGEVSS